MDEGRGVTVIISVYPFTKQIDRFLGRGKASERAGSRPQVASLNLAKPAADSMGVHQEPFKLGRVAVEQLIRVLYVNSGTKIEQEKEIGIVGSICLPNA